MIKYKYKGAKTINNNKIDLILFLLFILISLLTAFAGKVVAMYFELKAIYGILIGFFIPAGIIDMLPISGTQIKDELKTFGLVMVVLIVPTLGLSIIFAPFIGISIFLIVVAIKGFCAMPTFLLNFFHQQLKKIVKIKKQKTKIRDILQFSSLIYNLYNAKI